MKITNLSGKKVLLIPGDNEPASGMPINANVIAVITKNVAVVEPNVPAVQFAVVDAETRKQFLLINGSQLITLRPIRNKNVVPISLIIGKPSKSEVTYSCRLIAWLGWCVCVCVCVGGGGGGELGLRYQTGFVGDSSQNTYVKKLSSPV